MAEIDERVIDDEELAHFGTPRRSGRYPWGSGGSPMQRGNVDFAARVAELKRQGLGDPAIAEAIGLSSTTELRAKLSIAKSEKRQSDASQALRLKDKGMSNVAIGQRMGINESSVRALLDPAMAERRTILENTSNFLKGEVDKGGYLDVGRGTENWLGGISSTRLNTAIALLKEQGYEVRNIRLPQQFGRGKTTTKVLCPPGTGNKYIDPSKIKTVAAFSEDRGKTITRIKPPASVSSSRISVRHAEQGGGLADGVIYLRPGVPDLSLGSARYAQVRIAVDKTHYLKGMAMYKDDLPPGVDILFNTSKHDTGNPLDAMKRPETEGDTPWTTLIRRQRTYTDAQGRTKLSPINIVNEEGRWREWHPSLSSQVLSKQSHNLAKKQLDWALSDKVDEFHEIRNLTNPVVKKKLLLTFGDEADAASVHLKAHALPRQGTHVILPLDKIREGEIYAPNFRNGETVALIRHPHGGPFEIPELTVNNKNAQGRNMIGRHAVDAVGIHPNVAKRLSGADFDGDAVLVIPNNKRDLRTSPALAGVKDFDPQAMYPKREGMQLMTKGMKQQHMGDVSNLITDMTIKGAKPDEIARAVRHSMVVIDAEKHELDHQRSYKENGIAELKARYQGRSESGRLHGASTLISRAGSQARIPERRPRPYTVGEPGNKGPINPITGRKEWQPTGRMTTTKTGAVKPRLIKSTKLAEEADARRLMSKPGTAMEEIYAAHSNSLKALANQARLEALRTGRMEYSRSSAKTYRSQVASLNAKLNIAKKNAPLERQAQIIAKSIEQARVRDNPSLRSDADALKKVKAQALNDARARVGARKDQINILEREWEAIQSGAISSNKLSEILDNADLERVKVLATPRVRTVMTTAKMSRARSMLATGYTQADVADALGIPVSTLNSALLSEGG